ncbi:hypothetical protein C8A00DRAFT_14725, partial [Chaetomidium leptoderma]
RRKGWTLEKSDEFSAYMGQAVWAWSNVTELAVKRLFSGEEESIRLLTQLISNGKLTPGNATGHAIPDEYTNAEMEALVIKAFYSYTIPAIWTVPALGAFVMDSGYTCDHIDPVTPKYMDADTAHATWTCYNNKLYYLVHANKGPARERDQVGCGDLTCTPDWDSYDQKFTILPGLHKLGTTQYGHITHRDLIIGAVRTYEHNGRKNGAGVAKISNRPTVNDLVNIDITTPGYVRIPVCGPAEAYANWLAIDNADRRDPGFPCNKVG